MMILLLDIRALLIRMQQIKYCFFSNIDPFICSYLFEKDEKRRKIKTSYIIIIHSDNLRKLYMNGHLEHF